MELYACIEGIKIAMHRTDFDSFDRVAIYSDSQYVVDNRQRAFFIWSRNKWCNYQGKPVDNATLWKELLNTIKKCRKGVDFYWVKGHAKNQHNKAADKLARQSSRIAINPPLTVVKVRRKLSAKSVERGCVPMQNQRISISVLNSSMR
jgi:ribonuclease HI